MKRALHRVASRDWRLGTFLLSKSSISDSLVTLRIGLEGFQVGRPTQSSGSEISLRGYRLLSTTHGEKKTEPDPLDPDVSDEELLRSFATTTPLEGTTNEPIGEDHDSRRDMNRDTEIDNVFGMGSLPPLKFTAPPIPYTGKTSAKWILQGDETNPYLFHLLDLSGVICESDPKIMAPGNTRDTEKTLDEIMRTFEEISQGVHGASVEGGSPSASSPSSDFTMAQSSDQPNMRAEAKNHSIPLNPPLIIRYPVRKSMYKDIHAAFAAPIQPHERLKREGGDASTHELPGVRILQKASLSGGRYDVYYCSEGPNLAMFFASTAILSMGQDNQGEGNGSSSKGEANQPLPRDGTVALERHHILALREQPTIKPLPPPLVALQAHEDDPVEGVLQFTIVGVVSTYTEGDSYGPPPSEASFRRREADFLIRNILFGINLPAPIPSKFIRALTEDVVGSLSKEESQKRREVIARYLVGLYGFSTDFASIESVLEYPVINPDSLFGNVEWMINYTDPSRYFDDSSVMYSTTSIESPSSDTTP